ncbi:MAG: hypothetical protein H5T64_07040 [Chloroflexi bacterium]|nr:hypothetical protein [Chloroflexota bacterium]
MNTATLHVEPDPPDGEPHVILYHPAQGIRVWYPWDDPAPALFALRYERVVTFRVRQSDLRALACGDRALARALIERTTDLHDLIRRRTGRRVSLRTLVALNLGEPPPAPSPVDEGGLAWEAATGALILLSELWTLYAGCGLLWVGESERLAWPPE